MNKRIILTIVSLLVFVSQVSAEDNVTIKDFSISAGETKTMSVELDNDVVYAAFQFDLYLPEGITITEYSTDKNRVPESTSLTMTEQTDGCYRFLAAAMDMEEINGTSGSIITIKVTADETLESGSLTGYFRNIKLSKTDGTGKKYSEMSFPITVLAPSIVRAKSFERVYGEANPEFGFVEEGGTLDGAPEITCDATETSPVGTYDIIIKRGTETNYNVTYVKGTLTITKAPLKITANDYTIKQGEALPTFEATYVGFKNGETSAVLTKQPTITTTATSGSAIGEYDIIVSGAEAQNYEISYVKGKLTITEADALTVTAKSYTIVYGDDIPTFEYTCEGAKIVGTPSISCEATKTSSVGTYPIVISKGTVANYNDTYVNGTLTIVKAPLKITAKDYTIKQGEALPAFEATYEGFKNNETSAVLKKQPTITTTATSASAPGEYEITVSGAEAQNYEISYAKGKLTIVNADALIITAKSYTIEYGEEIPSFEYTSEGAALSGTPTISCTATKASPVGTYDIIISKGSVTNYNDTYVNGKLTITKASLKITAKDYTIKQGETLPAFEATYEGFKNGESSAVLKKQPTITTTATSGSAIGDYDITVSGAEAQNYEISYVKGKLTITQADALTVTAKSYTIVYGDDIPTFEYTCEGAKIVGTPSISCEATKTSSVGTYPIVISKGTVANYNDTYVNGTLTIVKAPLKITAKDYTIKQGEALPAFEATYEGFKNNETSAVLKKQPTITTTATSASAPGEYEITVSGAEAQNYEISYAKGKLTIVNADALIITAKSYTIEYGEEIPTFEYTSEGAPLEGEPSIACEAKKGSPVGTYDIIISKGSVTNYNVTYVKGTLTITKAPLKITAKDYTIKQGESLPAFEATYEGFKNGETSAVLTKQPTITTTATSASAPGEYDITVSGAEAQNYEISYVKGKLTIIALGDANGDGKVDAADIADIVNYMMGKPTSTRVFNEEAADVNDDGVVNAADVVQIANIILGN